MSNPYKLTLSKYSTHNIIREQIGKNKIVLDVGCNDGYIGKVSDPSNIFYGLDYLEESVSQAKSLYKDALLYDLNNLKDLSWDVQFDVIVFADVLEHVLFPEKTLSFFVNKYLKKDGIIIISLPNVANWQIRLKLLLGNFDYQESGILDKTHLHLYTFKSARELVYNCKLSMLREYGGASFFGPFIKYVKALSPLLATNIILINEKK